MANENRSATPRAATRMHAACGVALFFAASAHAAPPALTPREKGDLAIQTRAVLRTYCHECHGGKANRGRVGVLDHPKLVAAGPHPVPFVKPGDAAA